MNPSTPHPHSAAPPRTSIHADSFTAGEGINWWYVGLRAYQGQDQKKLHPQPRRNPSIPRQISRHHPSSSPTADSKRPHSQPQTPFTAPPSSFKLTRSATAPSRRMKPIQRSYTGESATASSTRRQGTSRAQTDASITRSAPPKVSARAQRTTGKFSSLSPNSRSSTPGPASTNNSTSHSRLSLPPTPTPIHRPTVHRAAVATKPQRVGSIRDAKEEAKTKPPPKAVDPPKTEAKKEEEETRGRSSDVIKKRDVPPPATPEKQKEPAGAFPAVKLRPVGQARASVDLNKPSEPERPPPTSRLSSSTNAARPPSPSPQPPPPTAANPQPPSPPRAAVPAQPEPAPVEVVEYEMVQTAFGLMKRRKTRIIVPPLQDGSVASRNPKIQMEVESLREQKKVQGGGRVLEEKGLSYENVVSVHQRTQSQASSTTS